MPSLEDAFATLQYTVDKCIDICESKEFPDEVMAHALQSKLPFEIVRLIEEHVAAMVLQTMVWRWRGRRMRAEARNRRENEWELRVECYIGSFAYGHQPMTNPMNGWSKEGIAWFQRYSRSSFERYSR